MHLLFRNSFNTETLPDGFSWPVSEGYSATSSGTGGVGVAEDGSRKYYRTDFTKFPPTEYQVCKKR